MMLAGRLLTRLRLRFLMWLGPSAFSSYRSARRWSVHKPKDIDEAIKSMGGATPEDIRRNTVKSSKLRPPTSRQWPDIEAYAAAALREQIGSVRCVGDEWYVQKNGVWYPKNKDEFRAIAL